MYIAKVAWILMSPRVGFLEKVHVMILIFSLLVFLVSLIANPESSNVKEYIPELTWLPGWNHMPKLPVTFLSGLFSQSNSTPNPLHTSHMLSEFRVHDLNCGLTLVMGVFLWVSIYSSPLQTKITKEVWMRNIQYHLKICFHILKSYGSLIREGFRNIIH